MKWCIVILPGHCRSFHSSYNLRPNPNKPDLQSHLDLTNLLYIICPYFWFNNGNITLIAQNAALKARKDRLARHCFPCLSLCHPCYTFSRHNHLEHGKGNAVEKD